jgi:hypothetical protein
VSAHGGAQSVAGVAPGAGTQVAYCEADVPPQSTAVSLAFFTPSAFVAAWQTHTDGPPSAI